MATDTDTSSSGHNRAAPPPSNTFHPVFAVNNIKNFIPILLDQEEGQYASWVELFHIHACAYDVLDHINTSVPRPPLVDAPTWNRIDAIIKQWIYSTISKDLLQTIMKPGATAQELWTRLEEKFQDNKHTRVVCLEEQFNTTRLENFSNMSEHVKHVAEQLANVGNPISSRGADFYETERARIRGSWRNLRENDVDFYETERIAPKASNSVGTPGYVNPDFSEVKRNYPSMSSVGRYINRFNNKEKDQR